MQNKLLTHESKHNQLISVIADNEQLMILTKKNMRTYLFTIYY